MLGAAVLSHSQSEKYLITPQIVCNIKTSRKLQKARPFADQYKTFNQSSADYITFSMLASPL